MAPHRARVSLTDMAFMNSSGLLHIGIGIFDREHGELLEIIIALQAEIEGQRRNDVTGPLLESLAYGIDEHFQSEEAMMARSKYPGLLLHAMKHKHLIEQLMALRARYIKDNSILDKHAIGFLRDWFFTHIETDDANFGLWQNETGKR
jgi:hemerythrin